jgi:glycosyltransferase involved in cell wall biosynthesis
MKIIYIITFSPPFNHVNLSPPTDYILNSENEPIGYWDMDRGHQFAKDIKKIYPQVEYEVWQLNLRADKIYKFITSNGIIHYAYPCKYLYKIHGAKIKKTLYSKEVISGLQKLYQKSEKIILHIPGDYCYLSYRIMKKFRNKIPIINTMHLDYRTLDVDLKTDNVFKFIHRFLIKYRIKKYLNYQKEIIISDASFSFFLKNTKANIYKRRWLGFDLENFVYDTSKKAARDFLGIDENVFVILLSSRLVPEKNVDTFINALSLLKNKKFLCLVTGTGEAGYINYLLNLIDNLKLSGNIKLKGFVQDDIKYYYTASDLFVNCSLKEAGPVSALKALAFEIPVLTTKTGFIYDILKNYNCKYYLENNNINKWAQMLEKIIKGEIYIKKVPLDKFRHQYSLKESMRDLMDKYEKTLKNFNSSGNPRYIDKDFLNQLKS